MLYFITFSFIYCLKNTNFAHAMHMSQETYNDFISGRIESFYATAYAPLLMFAIRKLGNDFSFLAEDCVQDAVFEAYQHRSNFDNSAKLKSYLYRCVHNNAITFLRKSNSHSNYLASISKENEEAIVNAGIIEQDVIDILYDAIEQLPQELKSVFEMGFEMGMKNQEIADELGISIATVKKRKAKLIHSLRNKLTDDVMMMLLFYVGTV